MNHMAGNRRDGDAHRRSPPETTGFPGLVSIIIPARNAERFLSKAIASACTQTYANIEVLVIDDRSTDATPEIASAWASKDARVRLLKSGGTGVSAARNTGLAEARGELIATLDADDLWHPDKLARQVARLNEGPSSVGLVYCWSAAIDHLDNILTTGWARSEAEGSILPILIRYSPPGNGSTPLMRRNVVEAVGGYDTRLTMGEDSKLYIAMAERCEFAVVRAPLVGYRLTDANASLDYVDMDRGIDAVTAWIEASWPSIARPAMNDRAGYMAAYLAMLAIRRRHFVQAVKYFIRSVRANPAMIFRQETVNFWGMWFSHRFGLNFYDWRFWRPRVSFVQATRKPQSSAQRERRLVNP